MGKRNAANLLQVQDYLPLSKTLAFIASWTVGNCIRFNEKRNEFEATTQKNGQLGKARRFMSQLATVLLGLQTTRLMSVLKATGFIQNIPSVLLYVGFSASYRMGLASYKHAGEIAQFLNTLVQYEKRSDGQQQSNKPPEQSSGKLKTGNFSFMNLEEMKRIYNNFRVQLSIKKNYILQTTFHTERKFISPSTKHCSGPCWMTFDMEEWCVQF